MVVGRRTGFAVALCALTLHGCGNSSSSNSPTLPGIPGNLGQSPADDGDGLQAGDEMMSPSVNLPGEHPEPTIVIGPEGDSAVVVDERRYPLDSALGDIWGVSDDHYNVNFTVTNGKFVVTPTDIDGRSYNLLLPVSATAIVYAEMYSPGDMFAFVTYSYSPFGAGGGVLAGNPFFDNAFIGYDVDKSGNVEDDEKLSVIGGTIDFTGILPDIEVQFSMTLENGQLAEGHYTGLFDFTDRQ